MNAKTLKVIGILALAAAAIVTVVTMLRASEGKMNSGTLLFLVWAVSPYPVFFAASALLERFASAFQMAAIFCVISVLMLAATFLFYVGTLTGESSTEALIFVFAPVYLYIGGFILLAAGFVLARLAKQK